MFLNALSKLYAINWQNLNVGAIEFLTNSGGLPINVTKEFGQSIDCKSSSIDLVFARQVFQHANDLEQLCNELYRVLRPGGKLISVRGHVISSQSGLTRFYDIHPLHIHNLYGREHAYTEKEYTSAMTNAGFQVECVFRPFDSVINFEPYTHQSLRVALIEKMNKSPIIGSFHYVLNNEWVYADYSKSDENNVSF